MFIHTDFLRAALCCVADEKEKREYLRGVRINPTHIQACNRGACVSMEHGADSKLDAVFIIKGGIPASAEGTYINLFEDGWMAIHVDEHQHAVGSSQLTKIDCQYPDFSKILPAEPEPCDALPYFQAKYLALPQQMFGRDFGCLPVKFKPYGKEAGCQLIFDDCVNYMYGNPFMVIMPLRDNAFELLGEVLNDESV